VLGAFSSIRSVLAQFTAPRINWIVIGDMADMRRHGMYVAR
jgi:hypothetical protein